jgi:hypothetical protein
MPCSPYRESDRGAPSAVGELSCTFHRSGIVAVLCLCAVAPRLEKIAESKQLQSLETMQQVRLSALHSGGTAGAQLCPALRIVAALRIALQLPPQLLCSARRPLCALHRAVAVVGCVVVLTPADIVDLGDGWHHLSGRQHAQAGGGAHAAAYGRQAVVLGRRCHGGGGGGSGGGGGAEKGGTYATLSYLTSLKLPTRASDVHNHNR